MDLRRLGRVAKGIDRLRLGASGGLVMDDWRHIHGAMPDQEEQPKPARPESASDRRRREALEAQKKPMNFESFEVGDKAPEAQ